MKIAVQMDHISTLHIEGDTTFALMLEAQARGHELFHYTTDRLGMRDGKVFAGLEPVSVQDVEGDHYTLGEKVHTDLSTMDVILMRQDPPFHMGYITATHILERIHPDTLVLNYPAEVRNAPEKIFVTEYPDLMPPTLISRNTDDINAFREEFGDIIVKPLYGNGGAGVFRVTKEDQNLSSLLEMFDSLYPEPYVIQQYLPDVRAGDKRIILIDGEPVGAITVSYTHLTLPTKA